MNRQARCEAIFYDMLGEIAQQLGSLYGLRVKKRVTLERLTSDHYRSYVPFRLASSRFDVDLWTMERGFDLYVEVIPKLFRIRLPFIKTTVFAIAYPEKRPPGPTLGLTDVLAAPDALDVCRLHISKVLSAATVAVPLLKENPIKQCYAGFIRTARRGIRDGLRSLHNY